MKHKNKLVLVFVTIIGISFFCNTKICYGNSNIKKVVVIGSYSLEDEWENSIIRGIADSVDNDISVKIEFLDSKSVGKKEYKEGFMDLLNYKYDRNNTDYIIVIDDEAFDLVRENLFNENSFVYKKSVIFLGINKYLDLSQEEKKYITGMFEYQSNLENIDIILQNHKSIKDIYLMIDSSIYSQTIKYNMKGLERYSSREFNLHIIEESYLENISELLAGLDKNTSAIYICGTFRDHSNNEKILASEALEEIKSVTDVPIYTKLMQYVEVGAIGGVVNDGYKVGRNSIDLLRSIIDKGSLEDFIPIYNNMDIPYFNFQEVRKYKINPKLLPNNTVYINKGKFDLLIPKYQQYTIWISMSVFLIGIVLLLYLFISNRNKAIKNRGLLNESIERDKIRTDFFITISHELRTPLNIIINASALLKTNLINGISREVFEEKLEYITRNSNRLLRLVNNLIDVSKIEAGYMDTKFENENIVEVVEDTTLSIIDLATNFDISVIFDTEEEEIITAIDKNKIERIILNLLSNAIKFTPDNGSILVNVKKEESKIIITIEDNGIGMSEELQRGLFQKFKRAEINTSLNRQNEGSGLGLFIVKGLVELHKGNIEVESVLQVGTKFIIILPIVYVDEDKNDEQFNDNSIDRIKNIEVSDIGER